jgi:proteasome lid subunit RPN8/RPN11
LSNPDEIVFDEVAYREPRRLRRPDRDPSRACLTYGVPSPGDLPIFLDHQPADAIERHALRDTSVELGGILLGYECLDEQTGEPFVWVTQAIEAKHYENTQASFTYTHDSWAEITRERDEKFPDLDIVGWYHTHPDFGIFLSGHDLFIHHHFFAQPLQVAYVVDPIRQTRGFFRWSDGRMEPVGGFSLCSERTGRVALARLVNDLERLPNPEGAGGGITPRLEAELIAMLNRPHTPTVITSPSSVAQTGAVFTLLGVVLGVLGMAAVLWLNALTKSIRDQGESLQALQSTVARSLSDAASAEVAAREAALNALLADVRVGDSPRKFLDLYAQVYRERDEARKQVQALTTEKAALNELATRLRNERAAVDSQLAESRKRADALDKQTKTLEKRYSDELRALSADLKEQARLVDETGAGALARRYGIAWYTAAGAVAACLLMGLGLVWALARTSPSEGPDEDRHEIR